MIERHPRRVVKTAPHLTFLGVADLLLAVNSSEGVHCPLRHLQQSALALGPIGTPMIFRDVSRTMKEAYIRRTMKEVYI